MKNIFLLRRASINVSQKEWNISIRNSSTRCVFCLSTVSFNSLASAFSLSLSLLSIVKQHSQTHLRCILMFALRFALSSPPSPPRFTCRNNNYNHIHVFFTGHLSLSHSLSMDMVCVASGWLPFIFFSTDSFFR
jgi:hypothetical protein